MPREWFESCDSDSPFASLYEEEFNLPVERTLEEVSSVEKLIRSMNEKPCVLDLAGGFGRIGSLLIQRGLVKSLTNLDLNRNLLKVAKTFGIMNVVEGDMRYLGFMDDTFDLTLLMFTSFGYFAAPEDDLKVLQEAKRVLRPGGMLLVDLPNYDRILTDFRSERELLLPDRSKIIYKKALVDDFLIETRTRIFSDMNQVQMCPIRLRIYNQESAKDICWQAGFSNVYAFDQSLQAYEPITANRLWLVCTS